MAPPAHPPNDVGAPFARFFVDDFFARLESGEIEFVDPRTGGETVEIGDDFLVAK